jgi:NAD(P)-dependent dehydrogenase (short-subunit alcohol dehydrogenase family)
MPDASVTVILGAGGGIGAACCREFATLGRRIVAADLRLDAARTAITGLANASAHALDVTSPDALDAFADEVGRIGVVSDLIYAPGLVMTAPIDATDWRKYRALMAVNLDGAFYACAAFARVMKRHRKGGAIVLIASTAGRRGEAGASHYCASKFAIIGLAESLAAELSGDAIRVNAVCPGNVDTPMLGEAARQIAAYRGIDATEVWQQLSSTGSARRLVTPDEVAAVCTMLCDRRASAMTGATVTVDAGAMVG